MRSLPLFLLLLTLAGPREGAAQKSGVRLEAVTRIGCLDCAGPELFSEIRDIAVWEGRIYVVEGALPPMIRIFDTGGASVRAFGRRGDGPGEFRFPIHIGVSGDGVEIFDYGHGRFTRFDSAGTAVRTRLVNTGQFPALQRTPGSAAAYIVTGDFGQTDQHVLRLADGDSVPVTVTTLTSGFPVVDPDRPMSRSPIAARPGGGVAVGDGRTQYRIRVFDDDGSIVRDIVRDIPRQRKTKREVEEERGRREVMAGRLAALFAERGVPKRALPGVTVDEERAHFRAIEYDDAGRLWVRTERGHLHETIFDIFDPAGRYLGELNMPHRLAGWTVGSGLLVAGLHDADGVQYVAIWRIR